MTRILQSIVGGIFIMATAAFCWLIGGGRFFVWVCAWPVLILRPFFPEAAPDQIFPPLGGLAGIFMTLIFATLTYALLIYLILWRHARSKPLP